MVVPSDLFRVEVGKVGTPPILEVQLELEYSVASKTEDFRKGLNSDTAITVAGCDQILIHWDSILNSIMQPVAGNRMDYFLDTRNCSSSHWTIHYEQIKALVGNFLFQSPSKIGCVISHTASWVSPSFWKLRVNATTTEVSSHNFLDAKNTCMPFVVSHGLDKESLSPSIVAPYLLNWSRPDQTDEGIHVESKERITSFPGQKLSSKSFSQFFSWGQRNRAKNRKLSDAVEDRECPIFYCEEDQQVILGGFCEVRSYPCSHGKTFRRLAGHSLRDVISFKVGRFRVSNTVRGAVPYVEFLIFNLHPYSFEIVSLGTDCHEVHEVDAIDFSSETHFGKWLCKHLK
jgi:hypothetical protein